MTVQIALRISDELAGQLDATVDDGFESRSEALRVAIEEFVSRRKSARLDREIVEGYKRIPSAETDEWGSVETAHVLTSTILARALDEEDGGW
jgi:metal-responsive CopG/Arc/MetJ family transcriptional regulator